MIPGPRTQRRLTWRTAGDAASPRPRRSRTRRWLRAGGRRAPAAGPASARADNPRAKARPVSAETCTPHQPGAPATGSQAPVAGAPGWWGDRVLIVSRRRLPAEGVPGLLQRQPAHLDLLR